MNDKRDKSHDSPFAIDRKKPGARGCQSAGPGVEEEIRPTWIGQVISGQMGLPVADSDGNATTPHRLGCWTDLYFAKAHGPLPGRTVNHQGKRLLYRKREGPDCEIGI